MTLTRTAALAAIVITASVAGATAKPIATIADSNLRKEPKTDTPILTHIPKGTTVEVGYCSSGWCEVAWNGEHGYVISQNLGLERPRHVVEEYHDEYRVYDEPHYVYGPPVYYGYGPYWGYRGGWGRRW